MCVPLSPTPILEKGIKPFLFCFFSGLRLPFRRPLRFGTENGFILLRDCPSPFLCFSCFCFVFSFYFSFRTFNSFSCIFPCWLSDFYTKSTFYPLLPPFSLFSFFLLPRPPPINFWLRPPGDCGCFLSLALVASPSLPTFPLLIQLLLGRLLFYRTAFMLRSLLSFSFSFF